MMRDTAMQDHLAIVGLLPDFVLGHLDETSLRRVSRHLEVCSICRDECADAMEILGLLAVVAPPPTYLRGAILRRAAATEQTPGALGTSRGAPAPRQKASAGTVVRLISDEDRQHDLPFGQPARRWTLAVASLAVLLVAGSAGLVYEQHGAGKVRVASQDQRIQALVNDPAAAFPLDDSDLPLAATGVVFAEPDGRDVYLVANGLPVLPQYQRYQVWLFTADDMVSAGLVEAADDGEVRALLETPDPFANYVGVGLTAEPRAGSDGPTTEMVLGGSFPPLSAAVPAPIA